MSASYLSSMIWLYDYYKKLGERAMEQLPEENLFWKLNGESNCIAVLVKHLAGNMLSRFTDFLTTDGEKPWRNRDAEFEDRFNNREELLAYWNEGWKCMSDALHGIGEEHLEDLVYIRHEGHTVAEALNRQLAHYAYHIGQIVYIAKLSKGEEWDNLTIPRNKSREFNAGKLSQEREMRHFTEELREGGLLQKPDEGS